MCRCASWKATGHVDPGLPDPKATGLGRQIPILRILAQIVDDKATAGNHLAAVGADQLQRTLDQFGGDAAAAQCARGLGMDDDYRRRRLPVIRKRNRPLDVEFETALRLVVAYGGHASHSHDSVLSSK